MPGRVVPCVEVLIAGISGSAPRGAGTSMLVWQDGQEGTIGGGVLEWNAAARAREMLAQDVRQDRQSVALGPDIGQCCGGRVELLFKQVSDLGEAETEKDKKTPVYLYGAGHVGREIVRVMEGLPFAITWVDVAAARFPGAQTVAERLIKTNPAAAVSLAPDNAIHFVLTHSHSHDLEICHQVLSRPFDHLGVIGSKTKKTRFLKRLAELGHSREVLEQLQCPIGDRSLGKTPQGIAIGVAHWLMRRKVELEKPRGRGL
ncbi:MAG: xanthine dehydrogenase accessory protein XdhC [Rhodobacteraceae bacterium]|nr:xanthine dehydrogenase accessory protein XdhC [Paracoccaceae bacterium]